MGKQKPYGSKMEKFDVVGRSRGARNLPINIFIISKLVIKIKYLIFVRRLIIIKIYLYVLLL